MKVNDNIDLLIEQYHNYPWYDSVGLDKFGRFVVYVHEMTKEVMETVQHNLNGKQVLLAYSHAKPNQGKSRYVIHYDFTKVKKPAPVVIDDEDPDIDYLISELDRLEKLCGCNALQDIFFEEHDQKNAVTSVSKIYPQVRDTMHSLYVMYGFDLIYEELEM